MLCFVRVDEHRISTAPNRYFFKIFVYCRDNVVKVCEVCWRGTLRSGGGGGRRVVRNVLGRERGCLYISNVNNTGPLMDPCCTPIVRVRDRIRYSEF